MRGEYRGQRGVRPRDVCRSDRGDGGPARLFVCVGCRSQALICSCCDRGQIVRSIARAVAPIVPATARSVRPDGATKAAVGGGSPMLCGAEAALEVHDPEAELPDVVGFEAALEEVEVFRSRPPDHGVDDRHL